MGKLEGFREILKNTKHRKVTQIFCPRCCSPKIALNSSLDLWLTPRQYHCEECGYTGILVMELEEDKDTAAQDSAAVTDSQTKNETKQKEFIENKNKENR